MSALVVAFMLIAGSGVLPPSILLNIMFTWAMCSTCSPKLRCAGVGLNPYLSSGIAFARPTRSVFWLAQSLVRSPWMVAWANAVETVARDMTASSDRRVKSFMGSCSSGASRPPRTIGACLHYQRAPIMRIHILVDRETGDAVVLAGDHEQQRP